MLFGTSHDDNKRNLRLINVKSMEGVGEMAVSWKVDHLSGPTGPMLKIASFFQSNEDVELSIFNFENPTTRYTKKFKLGPGKQI